VCLTGLTGVKPFCGSRQLSPAGTGLTGVGQWTRGLVFGCVLGSEGCVLVPRFSSTPVATWTWPIWVVSRRHVLEVVFILLEFSSLSRKIFLGSHSLPPLWFAVSILQGVSEPVWVFVESNQSKIQGWRTRNGVRVLHTLMERTTRCGVSGWLRFSAERVKPFGMSRWTHAMSS
jgi:hypothetical protein